MNWRLSSRPFGSYVFLWIGVGLLLLTLLLIGGATSSRESDGWVVHTLEVLRALERFESAILQADLVSRTAPLTEESGKNALNELADTQLALKQLDALTRDNSRQAIRLKVLQSLTSQAAGSIRARVNSAVPPLLQPWPGALTSMLPLLETIKELRAEERRLLVQRQEARERNDAAFWRTTTFAMILNVGLIWWSYLASRSYILERNAREQQISLLNRRLGEQVAEIQELNSSLEQRIREKTSELEATVAKLRSTNAELERFAYIASHDLQEPLRQVASFNNLLSMKYGDRLDETAQRYLSYSIAGAKRLQLMVRGLLQYTVISSTPLKTSTIAAASLMKGVMLTLAAQIQASGASIDIDIPEGLMLTCDEESIRTVLESLLSNAMRFRTKETSPAIEVRFQQSASIWSVSVRDNGIGVDSRFATRIFEMFSRFHSVGEYMGAGAGLAIARKIVDKHGGTIEVVANGNGIGSTFTVRVPITLDGEKTLGTIRVPY